MTQHNIWAVVPAAGIGARMQSEVPKQYLPLAGKTVIEVSVEKLLACEAISGVVVALSAADAWWQKTALANHPRITLCLGGKERSDSVLNALQHIDISASADAVTWVLVHDAARPCVSLQKIQTLIDFATTEQCGAILAAPVADTLKRVNHGNSVQSTQDRSNLWQAHTPQLFPLKKLKTALEFCRAKNLVVTDEASAIEHVGGSVKVISDRRDNIKITLPEDLELANLVVQNQLYFSENQE